MGAKIEPSYKSSALCRPDQAALRVCGKTINEAMVELYSPFPTRRRSTLSG